MLTAGSSLWNIFWIVASFALLLKHGRVMNRLNRLHHKRKEQEAEHRDSGAQIETRNIPYVALTSTLTSGFLCLVNIAVYMTLEITNTHPANGGGRMSAGFLWVLYIRNILMLTMIWQSAAHKEEVYQIDGQQDRGHPPPTGKATRKHATPPGAWFPHSDEDRRETELH